MKSRFIIQRKDKISISKQRLYSLFSLIALTFLLYFLIS